MHVSLSYRQKKKTPPIFKGDLLHRPRTRHGYNITICVRRVWRTLCIKRLEYTIILSLLCITYFNHAVYSTARHAFSSKFAHVHCRVFFVQHVRPSVYTRDVTVCFFCHIVAHTILPLAKFSAPLPSCRPGDAFFPWLTVPVRFPTTGPSFDAGQFSTSVYTSAFFLPTCFRRQLVLKTINANSNFAILNGNITI